MDDIADASIYYGSNVPQILEWPAVTVELTEVAEVWRTFGGQHKGQKDAICTVNIGVYDKAYDYMTGLTSVEKIVKNIDDVIHSDMGISGITYYGENQSKRFSPATYNDTPILGAEITYTGKIRFTQGG
jgi:hypothetical protein